VALEKILQPETGIKYPRIVKGKNACPLEDCGGSWGYMNLVETLKIRSILSTRIYSIGSNWTVAMILMTLPSTWIHIKKNWKKCMPGQSVSLMYGEIHRVLPQRSASIKNNAFRLFFKKNSPIPLTNSFKGIIFVKKLTKKSNFKIKLLI